MGRKARRATGPRPAAGLLIETYHGGHMWFLLGHRSPRLGSVWANFGGSLMPGEDPLAGALREFSEEAAVPAHALVGANITAAIDCGTDLVPYTLFVLRVPSTLFDLPIALQWEHDDVAWIRDDLLPDLDLHHGLTRAFTHLATTV